MRGLGHVMAPEPSEWGTHLGQRQTPRWDPSKHRSFPEDKEHIWAQELGVLTGVFATYLLVIFFQESF